MNRLFAAALLLAVAACGDPASAANTLANCVTGATNCNNDTQNDAKLVNAMQSTPVANRVTLLWLQQCESFIFPTSDASTTGHKFRNEMCLAIAAGRIPPATLVAAIMNLTIQGQILSSTCTFASVAGTEAGCVVDADINAAITTAMTVTDASASANATQATVGSNNFTVNSATGILPGQTISCPGVPSAAVVTFVNGTTVTFNNVTTAALSSTACSFDLYGGLPTRSWG